MGASSAVRGSKWSNICLCCEFFCPRSFSLIRPTSWNRLGALTTTSYLCLSCLRGGFLGPKMANKLITLVPPPKIVLGRPWNVTFMDFSKTGNDFSTFLPITRLAKHENNPAAADWTLLSSFSRCCSSPSWLRPRDVSGELNNASTQSQNNAGTLSLTDYTLLHEGSFFSWPSF